MDLEKDYGLAGFKKATDLRKTWPHLKVNVHQKEKNTQNHKNVKMRVQKSHQLEKDLASLEQFHNKALC